MCAKVVMLWGQQDALHTEELDKGLYVELNLKMQIFWGGHCKARGALRAGSINPHLMVALQTQKMFPFSLFPIVVLCACERIILALIS